MSTPYLAVDDRFQIIALIALIGAVPGAIVAFAARGPRASGRSILSLVLLPAAAALVTARGTSPTCGSRSSARCADRLAGNPLGTCRDPLVRARRMTRSRAAAKQGPEDETGTPERDGVAYGLAGGQRGGHRQRERWLVASASGLARRGGRSRCGARSWGRGGSTPPCRWALRSPSRSFRLQAARDIDPCSPAAAALGAALTTPSWRITSTRSGGGGCSPAPRPAAALGCVQASPRRGDAVPSSSPHGPPGPRHLARLRHPPARRRATTERLEILAMGLTPGVAMRPSVGRHRRVLSRGLARGPRRLATVQPRPAVGGRAAHAAAARPGRAGR